MQMTFMIISMVALMVLSVVLEVYGHEEAVHSEVDAGIQESIQRKREPIIRRKVALSSNDLQSFGDLLRGNSPVPAQREREKLYEETRRNLIEKVIREEKKDAILTLVKQKIVEAKRSGRVAVDVGRFNPLFKENDETEKLVVTGDNLYTLWNMSVQEVRNTYQTG